MITQKQINATLSFQKKLLREYKKECKFLPEGTLYFFKRKSRTEIIYRNDEEKMRVHEKCMAEQQYVNSFRRKKCVLKSIKILEENTRILEAAKKRYRDYDAELIYENMPKGYSTKFWHFDGVPATTQERFAAAIEGQVVGGEPAAIQRQRVFKPEGLTISTCLGYDVRSKSEALIVNILNGKGLEFEYEPEIEINGNIYHPDFVIKGHSKMEIIWEHLGMIDDPEYLRKAANKIADYLSAGYEFGKTLFITSESKDSPLDFQLVSNLADIIKSIIDIH